MADSLLSLQVMGNPPRYDIDFSFALLPIDCEQTCQLPAVSLDRMAGGMRVGGGVRGRESALSLTRTQHLSVGIPGRSQ